MCEKQLCKIMEVKPNMIINNYFHGEFSQAEAAES